MQRIATSNLVLVNTSNRAAANPASSTLTESQAAEAMWVYYRDNKWRLVSDIREHRAGILAQLMDGIPVAQVFAPFAKPATVSCS